MYPLLLLSVNKQKGEEMKKIGTKNRILQTEIMNKGKKCFIYKLK